MPFQYFGVSDDVDLRQLEWKCGNYDTAQLNNLYTGNDARAAKVIRERRDRVTSTEGKAVLTVMDFIGQQHREFRFDLRYRALTGYGLKELVFGAIRERCEGDRSTRDSWTGYLRQAGLLEGFSPLETVLSGRTRELSDADANRLLLMKSTLKEEAKFIRHKLPARREVMPPIAVPPGHPNLPQVVGACGRRRCL